MHLLSIGILELNYGISTNCGVIVQICGKKIKLNSNIKFSHVMSDLVLTM